MSCSIPLPFYSFLYIVMCFRLERVVVADQEQISAFYEWNTELSLEGLCLHAFKCMCKQGMLREVLGGLKILKNSSFYPMR